jgi:hypothetical protein
MRCSPRIVLASPLLIAPLLAGLLAPVPARACGFGEAPVDCGDTAENAAKYMLNRVVAAIAEDKAKALREFARGEAGFRTVDSYVFCVGPDGIMTAHPSPMLQGQDVRGLHDETGNYFIATMLKNAQPGQIAQIRYLFPRPGASTASPKTTFYTRAGDQVCGVGVYDADDPATASLPLAARLTALRDKLTAGMPASLSADWTAYQQALDEDRATRAAALAKARDDIRAADAMLAMGSGAPADH